MKSSSIVQFSQKLSLRAAANCLFIAIASLFSLSAQSQNYPNAPIRFIYPAGPGSILDVAFRSINEEAAKHLGQPIVQVNRAGAGGRTGFAEMMRAKPDGYTLGAVQSVTAVLQPLIDPVEWKADAGKDYTAIMLTFEYPLILVAKKSAPYKDLPSFLKYAKDNPGKINAASSGVGTGTHLGIAALNIAGGVNITHVPFAGNAPGLQSLVAGDVDVMWTDGAAKPFVDSGNLIALAVASSTRWNMFPNVPTTLESGFGKIIMQSWSAIGGPPGMSPAMVEKVTDAYSKVLADPAVRAKLAIAGLSVIGGNARDLNNRVIESRAIYEPLIRATNVKRE